MLYIKTKGIAYAADRHSFSEGRIRKNYHTFPIV